MRLKKFQTSRAACMMMYVAVATRSSLTIKRMRHTVAEQHAQQQYHHPNSPHGVAGAAAGCGGLFRRIGTSCFSGQTLPASRVEATNSRKDQQHYSANAESGVTWRGDGEV
jgi:hypothetical protein